MRKVTYTVPEDVAFHVVGGEAVLLHLGDGVAFTLDARATRVWELIAKHGDLDRVGEEIRREMGDGAPPEAVRREIEELVQDLVSRRLLRHGGRAA